MASRDTTESADRVIVFMDEANVYNDARRCFHNFGGPSSHGRVKPMRYGMLLASRQPLGTERPRELKEVRVYTGTPSSSKESAGYAVQRRRTAAWANKGATVITRPLRYPQNWPNERPAQKGIDVQIALDVVTMGLRGDYDVAILASTDTDLRPALEAICELSLENPPVIEVAAWRKGTYAKRLDIEGAHVWCHYLEETDYESVRDRRDYSN
jgi:uncharacterized LabA/DUF88 family protein